MLNTCPICESKQIEVDKCLENKRQDVIKCRECGCSAPRVAWQIKRKSLIQGGPMFNAAINFAIDNAGIEADIFLRMWREGSFEQIRNEFPEFKGPFP